MAKDKLLEMTWGEPDLPLIQAELEDILEDSARNLYRRDDFDRVRFCQWDGQSDDGRKHEDATGEQPIPWENASDVRVRLADRITNEHVNLALESFFRANMRVSGIEKEDRSRSAYWTDILKYFLEQHILPELRREVEILAQQVFGTTPAIGIMGCYWHQQTHNRLQKFDLNTLAQFVVANAQSEEEAMQLLNEFQMILQDEEMDERLVELVSAMFPAAVPKRVKRAIKDFRKTGQAELPVPYLTENRPKFTAHRLYDDIFVHSTCTDLERASMIVRREWYTETELREKTVSEGWSESFVEKCIEKTEGLSNIEQYDHRNPLVSSMARESRGIQGNNDGLYEIFYAYTRQYDPENNTPAIFCTAFSSSVTDEHAKHEMLDYAHCKMPFVLFTRERLSRALFDSRGIPELVETTQYEVKTQRDLRNDASQINVIPPLLVNARRGGLNLLVAPASQITITRPDDVGWLQPPPPSQGSIEAEQAAENDAREYFGGEDPENRLLYRQAVVNRWLDSWRIVMDQSLRLCMQYVDAETAARIVGVENPAEVAIDPNDIANKFDLSLRFSADLLNPEFMEKKLEALKALTQFDVTGALDRNKLLMYLAEAIDPQLAKDVVLDPTTAQQREIDEEQNAWIKIANEIEPVMKEGVNFPLRLQVAGQVTQVSQEIQRKLNENENIQALAQNRMKYLQFGVQQQENAQIGRMGTKPIQAA